jgi:hypothetical protein
MSTGSLFKYIFNLIPNVLKLTTTCPTSCFCFHIICFVGEKAVANQINCLYAFARHHQHISITKVRFAIHLSRDACPHKNNNSSLDLRCVYSSDMRYKIKAAGSSWGRAGVRRHHGMHCSRRRTTRLGFAAAAARV